MNSLQKYNYIKILFIVSLCIIAIIYISDEKTTYEQITIQHGDSLWSLAERYKGNMSTDEWIQKVKLENNIQGEHIVAGGKIAIPIPENAIYIAINEENEIQSVEIASKEQ